MYRFFKTDASSSINLDSGEYMLLSGNQVLNEINKTKVREFYYNKNDKYLGVVAPTRQLKFQ
ncbi:DUF6503 family protein [Nonlabens sp.]|uniref:DUF6503 family protein n=1 Tax=Nonlabens sp. TaxID=1888209 RepID=UPI0039E3B0DF